MLLFAVAVVLLLLFAIANAVIDELSTVLLLVRSVTLDE